RGGGRERSVRRARRHHDQVDRTGRDAGRFQRQACGCGAQRPGGLARAGEPPLLDARAVLDPRVGGVDEVLEVDVGNDPLGEGRTDAGDRGEPPAARARRLHSVTSALSSTSRGGRTVSSSHTNGCPGATGSPSRTSTPETRAARWARTSWLTGPLSTMAIAWPATTHSCPSWNLAGGSRRRRPPAGETTRRTGRPNDSPIESGGISFGRSLATLAAIPLMRPSPARRGRRGRAGRGGPWRRWPRRARRRPRPGPPGPPGGPAWRARRRGRPPGTPGSPSSPSPAAWRPTGPARSGGGTAGPAAPTVRRWAAPSRSARS